MRENRKDVHDVLSNPQETPAEQEERQAEQKARAWVLGPDGAKFILAQHGGLITPSHLQRVHRIGFNAAARILEALEKDGELVRIPAPTLTWALAPKAARITAGYALPLSQREHEVLMNAIEYVLWLEPADKKDREAQKTLRAIRNKLKRPA